MRIYSATQSEKCVVFAVVYYKTRAQRNVLIQNSNAVFEKLQLTK